MLKKFSLAILTALLLFTSSKVFAANNLEQIIDGADLTTIKRLAVARPNHYKVPGISDEPTLETLIELIDSYDKAKNFTLIPYTEIVAAIKEDTGVDITTLDYKDEKNGFADNVGKYADAYVTLTTVNNDDPTIFMFKVQNAQTGDIMYLLKVRNGVYGKNSKGYNGACEAFYKAFDAAIDKQATKK